MLLRPEAAGCRVTLPLIAAAADMASTSSRYNERMRSALAATIVGVLISALGVLVSAVYLFQPWRSCEYEDDAAGCSMLPGDAAVMMVAVLAIPVGVVVAIMSLIASCRHRCSSPARRHSIIDGS